MKNNKLDEYDKQKMKKARKIINEVYEYNYDGYSPLNNKLETILKKIDKLIAEAEE